MIVYTESRKNPLALQDATVTIEVRRVGEEIDPEKEIEGTEAQAGKLKRSNDCMWALFFSDRERERKRARSRSRERRRSEYDDRERDRR